MRYVAFFTPLFNSPAACLRVRGAPGTEDSLGATVADQRMSTAPPPPHTPPTPPTPRTPQTPRLVDAGANVVGRRDARGDAHRDAHGSEMNVLGSGDDRADTGQAQGTKGNSASNGEHVWRFAPGALPRASAGLLPEDDGSELSVEQSARLASALPPSPPELPRAAPPSSARELYTPACEHPGTDAPRLLRCLHYLCKWERHVNHCKVTPAGIVE